MPNAVTIRRPEAPIDACITLPRSKSLANRALILAALAGDLSLVINPGDAEDTSTLLSLLKERPRVMNCGDGGTTFRFLLAWACVQDGEEHLLTGSARLMERPHAPLIDALIALGADITQTESGYLVRGRRMRGGTITLDSPMSSQFISALLLVAPLFEQGLELHWTGRKLSGPYVEMTVAMLNHFGVAASVEEDVISVPASPLKPASFDVPADWSAAAFWFEVAALAPDTKLYFKGIFNSGMQGDEAVIIHLLPYTHCAISDEELILHGRCSDDPDPYHADLTDTPDLFQPVTFALAGLGRKAELIGLDNLPHKETDRLKAVAEALRALGCSAEYDGGSFKLESGITNLRPQPFDPQGDHRMAMGLAPLALVCEEITILHPEVVAKSYPGFWEDLKRAGFSVELG